MRDKLEEVSLPLTKVDRLLYMPATCLGVSSADTVTASHASNTTAYTARPWSEIKTIIDRIHLLVCGHYAYGYMKTQLERNQLWNGNADEYVMQLYPNVEDPAQS